MATHNQISNTIWNVANLLRGSWKNYEYQDVILPLTVLKRLDAALEPTKQKVLERFNELDGKVTDFRILRRVTGYDFYNTSQFTFKRLLDDQTHVARNLRKYIDGFSPNIKDIFEKFDFEKQLERLHGSNILYLILQEFDKLDLHPESVPNHVIGLAFEDLIRRFAEQSNETAGEHYTPRDVVRLMSALIFSGEEKELAKPGKVITLYDPACGTGGMLTIGCDYIKSICKNTKVYLFGQELNPNSYAICKADILLQNEGKDPEGIKGGEKENDKASTLSNDQHADKKFDYIISNPPYGVEWKKDKDVVEHEAERGLAGRFGAGLPRISDGQFLFIQHAISKFRPKADGGSNAAIITNGSPLFTGDAGGGESEIRRWILESDLLEAIIAMPEQLFFNTGIATYVWIFSNRKDAERKGKVQLVDARKIRTQLRRNLGAKRYEINEENAKEILKLYSEFKENERCKIFPTTEFAYREITIQRPLRLSFVLNDEKIKELLVVLGLDIPRAVERVKEAIKQEEEQTDSIMGPLAEKRRYKADEQWEIQINIDAAIRSLRNKKWANREKVIDDVDTALSLQNGVRPAKKVLKTIVDAVGVRDENAEICLGKDGKPEPDKELKDFERVPWGQNIYKYFEKEVKPYASDAWIDESVRDHKDNEIGKVGYEIPLTRYFYKYEEPRKVEKIEKEVKETEARINELTEKL